jgi:hypothetical protein
MAWNTVYTTGDTPQPASVYNMYIAALEERSIIVAGSGPIDYVAAGDDAQDHLLWRRLQELFDGDSTVGDTHHVTAMHPAGGVGSDTLYFCIDKDYSGDDGTGGPASINEAGDVDVINWGYIKANALGGNPSFTRKHYREFTNLSATHYNWSDPYGYDPTAFADGHYARNLDDGKVYHRVSGAWVLTNLQRPDLITVYGLAEKDDVYGPWILNELRDVINLCEVCFDLWEYSNPVGRENQFGGGLGSAYSTWALAKAAEEANFNASSSGYYSTPGYQTAGYNDTSTMPASYEAGLTRTKADIVVQCFNAIIGCQVDVYNVGDNNPYSGTFNNSGDPVAFGVWTKWDSPLTFAASGADQTVTLGSIAVPTWVGDPSGAPNMLVTNGYTTPDRALRVYRLNVAGGLTYHA